MTKTFEQVYEGIPGNGWLTEGEARLLWKWLNAVDGDILEVGSYQGRSTVLLASVGRPVHAVDPFSNFSTEDPLGDATARALLANLADRDIENVTLYRQRIEQWQVIPVGLAYLDGDHSYLGTISQVQVAIIARAQVIAVHDVTDSGEGARIKQACLEQLGEWTERVERLAVWDRR